MYFGRLPCFEATGLADRSLGSRIMKMSLHILDEAEK